MTTNVPPRRPARVEPSADLRAASHQLRALYVALAEAGFAEREALDLVGQVVRELVGGVAPGDVP